MCGPGLRRRGVGIDACCFVEGGRASLNHAHYRGRTTPLRLSLTDVARVLRPHGFSICGFPREGREKIPNHAQWVLNHLRHGGGALSLQHAPFSKLAMPPRTYSRNLLQIFRQALRFEPTCVSSNPLSLVDRIVYGSPLFGECTARVFAPARPSTYAASLAWGA